MTLPTIPQARVDQLVQALLSIDRVRAHDSIFAPGAPPGIQELETVIIPALQTIGADWEAGRCSLAQVYMAGRICEEIVGRLIPAAAPQRVRQPVMAIAALEDYHLLGKRLVYSALRAAGFELLNYGRMSLEELVERVRRDRVRILLVSVLMLPSALKVSDLRRRLDEQEFPVRLIVGGAPFRFDPQLWQSVGADACGHDATDAIRLVRQLISEGA